jgi:capsule polysaccharide export protein KpsE/RkpR
VTADVADDLHALDARIEAVRRQIWQSREGLILVQDVTLELARLNAEYARLGEQYVETYRRWSAQNAER